MKIMTFSKSRTKHFVGKRIYLYKKSVEYSHYKINSSNSLDGESSTNSYIGTVGIFKTDKHMCALLLQALFSINIRVIHNHFCD